MKQKNNGSFSGDINKILIKYTAIPALLVFFLTFLCLIFLYYFSLQYSAERQATASEEMLDECISAYLTQLDTLQQDERMASAIEGNGKRELSQALYDFVNGQSVRAHYFLLDKDGECKLSSSTQIGAYLQVKPPFYSGLLYRLSLAPEKTVLMLNNIGAAREQSTVLSIGKAVLKDGELWGFIIFELDADDLMEYVQIVGVGELVVTDNFYNTLLTSKNSYLDNYGKLSANIREGQGLSDNGQILAVSRSLERLGLNVYVIVEIYPFFRALLMTSVLTVAFLVAIMLANVFVSKRLASIKTDSVDRLLCDIHKMQEEGIYTSLAPLADSDFPSLEETYTKMLDDIRALVESNKQEALMRTAAEIKQLESQFNPHFIFNTLEVIRCLIHLDPASADRMILDFSSLLRYSLDSTGKLVPLKSDLSYIEAYLSMIQMRQSIQLSYDICLEDGTDDCLVPKLCLQPIVENAVKYAALPNCPLRVTVSARREGECLLIIIQDDGAGLSDTLLADIREVLKQPAYANKYFGLYNVQRRIQLLYGFSYGLSLDSSAGNGTTITVRLPLKGGTAENV